jgi:hypothetical protein
MTYDGQLTNFDSLMCFGIPRCCLFYRTLGKFKYISMSAMFFLLSKCYQLSYRWDNARRNKLYGKPKPGDKVNTHEFADQVSPVLHCLDTGIRLTALP